MNFYKTFEEMTDAEKRKFLNAKIQECRELLGDMKIHPIEELDNEKLVRENLKFYTDELNKLDR